MVSITSFKSSSIQHDVHLVNYGPIYSQIDHKAGDALGRVVSTSALSMFSSYNFNPFSVHES